MTNFKVNYNDAGEIEIVTHLRGKSILTIPQMNKGTAFSKQERHDLHLLGKLPPCEETLDSQMERAYFQYCDYTKPIHKNIFLNVLHNTNEVLFHALIKKHFKEMMPIVYTPVVGDSVVDFSQSFRQTRGLYISYEDRDNLDEIIENRTNDHIDLIVITDGSGVLGIGDQGVGGMGIPIAKLVLYTSVGGISPYRTLPILLDVGTNNERLLDDPMYLGWRHARIEEDEYQAFIKDVIAAIKRYNSKVFVHWEDFSANHAAPILHKYYDELCSFNDDIQGTGVVALSAIITALRKKGEKLEDQRILIFGGGSAGCGIGDHLFNTLLNLGLSEKEVRERFWMIDRPGLLFEDTSSVRESQAKFARPLVERSLYNQYDLGSVIRVVKPTVLIGCSAVSGAFNKDALADLCSLVKDPVILPLSNPTDRAEAVPEDIYRISEGRAYVATGSPFPSFQVGGETILTGQCNNAYAFPGIGLAVVAVSASKITHNMLTAASEAISNEVMNNPYSSDLITPIPEMAIKVAKVVAYAVAKAAINDGVASKSGDPVVLVERAYWEPEYCPIRYLDSSE